jgi:hypothetical protein
MNDKPKNEVVVPPPPRGRTRGILAEVPKPAEAPDNMAKPPGGIQDMNFKMDADFHLAFKTAATMNKMAMKELLEASFRCWVEQYGSDVVKSLLPHK